MSEVSGVRNVDLDSTIVCCGGRSEYDFDGEFDFAFTSLGILIRTEPNSAWYVNLNR